MLILDKKDSTRLSALFKNGWLNCAQLFWLEDIIAFYTLHFIMGGVPQCDQWGRTGSRIEGFDWIEDFCEKVNFGFRACKCMVDRGQGMNIVHDSGL